MERKLKVSRRRLLEGVATLAVAAGAGWYAAGRGVFDARTGEPFAPWTAFRGQRGGELAELVRAAVLAASPHNTQPWLFEVHPDRIDVFSDRSRSLGTMDPFLREMHIGLGCAIENLALAAGSMGWAPCVELEAGHLRGSDPEGSRALERAAPRAIRVASVRIEPGAAESPLAEVIARRHTNRGPYQAQRVPVSALQELSRLSEAGSDGEVVWLERPDQRESFAAHTLRATETIVRDAAMVRDSDAWFRLAPEAVPSHRDGLTLDVMGLGPLLTAAVKLLPRPSAEQMHDDWLRVTREVHLAGDPAIGVIAVRDRYDLGATLGAPGACGNACISGRGGGGGDRARHRDAPAEPGAGDHRPGAYARTSTGNGALVHRGARLQATGSSPSRSGWALLERSVRPAPRRGGR